MKIVRYEKSYSAGVASFRDVEYTVAEAVKSTIADADLNRSGELERLQEKLDNVTEFVSLLVEQLTASGALKRGNLELLLSGNFKVQS